MRKLSIPVWGHAFAEDANDSEKKPSIDDQASALKKDNPEVYAAIFGRGSTKGAKEVTDAKVSATNDEQKQSYFDALRTEKVSRSLRKKAEAAGFIDPDDVVDLLGGGLTLNTDLEVISASNQEKANIDDAIRALAQKRPHLIKASSQKAGQNSVRPASETSSSKGEVKSFKRSQLRDSAFYLANEKDILAAARAGKIVDDIHEGAGMVTG